MPCLNLYLKKAINPKDLIKGLPAQLAGCCISQNFDENIFKETTDLRNDPAINPERLEKLSFFNKESFLEVERRIGNTFQLVTNIAISNSTAGFLEKVEYVSRAEKKFYLWGSRDENNNFYEKILPLKIEYPVSLGNKERLSITAIEYRAADGTVLFSHFQLT